MHNIGPKNADNTVEHAFYCIINIKEAKKFQVRFFFEIKDFHVPVQ